MPKTLVFCPKPMSMKMGRGEWDGKGENSSSVASEFMEPEVKRSRKTRASRPGPHMQSGRKILTFFLLIDEIKFMFYGFCP